MWEVYTNFFLHGINILLFFLCYQKTEKPHRMIGFTILITCILEVYAAKLKFQHQNNLFIYHFFAVFHYTMYALFYYQLIRIPWVRKTILLTIPAYLLFALVNTLFLQTLQDYNSYTLVVKHFLVSLWVMCYFLEIFLRPGELKLQREPFFWISTGLLVFSMGNFFIEGMMDYLIRTSEKTALRFYLTGVSLSYLFYATITVSYLLILTKRNQIPRDNDGIPV